MDGAMANYFARHQRRVMAQSSGEKTLYRWTRDFHLYFGLFVSPFVIAFAVSCWCPVPE